MSTKLPKIEIERIAVAFRNDPRGNHGHADVWNAMEKIGGRTAILYGMHLATPARYRWKKHDLGLDVASALDAVAGRTSP